MPTVSFASFTHQFGKDGEILRITHSALSGDPFVAADLPYIEKQPFVVHNLLDHLIQVVIMRITVQPTTATVKAFEFRTPPNFTRPSLP